MNPLVSIIVTTKYGSIDYAEKCLDSLVNQNLKNIEIIIVDDGFTKEQIEIIDNLIKDDKRIRFVHRAHSAGVNAARNTGIKCANGKYLTFVDFNDCLNDMFCWILSDYMNDAEAEIAICGILSETKTDVPSVGLYRTPVDLIEVQEQLLELAVCTVNDGMPESGYLIDGLNLVGGKMYSKAFLLDCPWVRFPEASTDGDGVVFLLRAIYAEPIIYMADVPLYILTDVSEGHTPLNDPEFVEHELERLKAINDETQGNAELLRATAREALCSLLNIEKSLKKIKGRDNKIYLKTILERPEYFDALAVFKQLGFSSNDQHLLHLSKQKKINQIIKEVS